MKHFKKLTALVLAGVMALSLAACGDSTGASSGAAAASSAAASSGAASSGAEVHGTIVYGKDFAGGISLAGGKNVQMIAKGLGSSGSDDPLNQRGTLGWKIRGYNATILEDAYIVRIEHGVSA